MFRPSLLASLRSFILSRTRVREFGVRSSNLPYQRSSLGVASRCSVDRLLCKNHSTDGDPKSSRNVSFDQDCIYGDERYSRLLRDSHFLTTIH